MKSENQFPITVEDLMIHAGNTNSLLTHVDWQPSSKASKILTEPSSSQSGYGFDSFRKQTSEIVKISDVIKGKSEDSVNGFSRITALTGSSLRTGIMLGYHISHEYAKSSGVHELAHTSSKRRLSEVELAEHDEKNKTAGAIAVYTLASYVVWMIDREENHLLDSVHVDFKGVPEMGLTNYMTAFKCFIYYYGWYLSKSNTINNELQALKMLKVYAEGVIEEIELRSKSLKYIESFETSHYYFERDDFMVRGFESQKTNITIHQEFVPQDIEEIVGNEIAIENAKRDVKKVCLYNFLEKSNPVLAVKGYQMIRLGHGIPGTGKSMMIAAIATLFQDYCDRRGVPFFFNQFPASMVSGLQGESAKNMEKWMKPMYSTDFIGYFAIDDAECNFMDRSRDNVSEGVRGIISVLLPGLEGPLARFHYNILLDFLTNLPEIIDPPVLNRMQGRYPIDGATKEEHWYAQNDRWLSDWSEVNPKVFNFEDFSFNEDEDQTDTVEDLMTYEIKNESIRKIADEIEGLYNPRQKAYYSKMLHATKEKFPMFSNRDLRNIQTSSDGRFNNWDVPDEWFDQHDLFFEKTFAEQEDILRGLMIDGLGGIEPHVLLQKEMLRYLDNFADIANIEYRRKVEERAGDMRIHSDARTLVLEKYGVN